jgi:hypothetical protein
MRSEAGMVGEAVKTGTAEVAPAERLVNLTEHAVMLVPQPQPATEGAAEAPLMCVPPDGRFARVDDDAARLHERLVDTESGVVRLTSLRRSGGLVDLPPPQPGIRYVVSRVTALAARDRDDLAFPFGEIRDEHGRVTGAQGLASFRPRAALWRRPWVWRAAARERRRGRLPGTQWLTGVFFAVATALLSGALSLFPGSLDEAKASGWGVAWASWTLRLTVVFAVAGAVALIVAAWRWHERSAILEERGTAYVIEENAITWRHEEKASVLTDVGAGFAAVLRVPGPAELGSSWRWEADGKAAPQWDARVDELVSSFWAVHYNDDQITRNAVYVWAPWPVAMAFGARATARRRGLVLHVRQRPSYGAAGPHRRPRLTDEAHDFLRLDEMPSLADTAPVHEPVVVRKTVTMTIKPLATSHSGHPAGHHSGQRPLGSAEGLLLIVRVIHGPVGPIPLDLAHASPFTIAVAPTLAGSVIPTGSWVIPAVEWRLDPREAGVGRVPDLPWAAFPAAAEAIADWIVEQAVAHSARTVLLATRIPQELAVGLGVQLGQRSWERKPGQQWPERVYPVFHAGTQLVVPDLRLGADSVPSQRPESS